MYSNTQMKGWGYAHTFIRVNVNTFEHIHGWTNECMIEYPFLHFLHGCPFIHRSHQVSLCASVTISACKKIIENQPFPNISEIFPNISQLYFRIKTIVQCRAVIISNQATCEPMSWCTDGVLISPYFHWVKIVSSTVSQDNAHMIIARYVMRLSKPRLCLITLAMYQVAITPKS